MSLINAVFSQVGTREKRGENWNSAKVQHTCAHIRWRKSHSDPGNQELPSADSHQWDACEILNLRNWAVPRIEMNLEALNLESPQSRWILGHPQPHASHWEESSHDLQYALTHRAETYWKRISFSFTVYESTFHSKIKKSILPSITFLILPCISKVFFCNSSNSFQDLWVAYTKVKIVFLLSECVLGEGCSTPHILVTLLIIFWQACN